MKQKIYLIGIASTLLIFMGAIFKINHLPGAAVTLTSGIGTLVLVFLPLALIDLYRSRENLNRKSLYVVTYITCFLVFTAMLFKILHWTFAGLLLTIALPFPYVVFLPVFLRVTSKDSKFSIYKTVFVLILLAVNSVFSGLLALNVSRERIYESYNISSDYLRQEKVLTGMAVKDRGGEINQKIEELMKLSNDYQDILLKFEGKSLKDWREHPESLSRPDAAGLALYLLERAGEPSGELRLEKGLHELTDLLGKDHDYAEIAAIAPDLFDFRKAGEADTWEAGIFRDNTLAWSLMYLDGLKSSLLMIRSAGR